MGIPVPDERHRGGAVRHTRGRPGAEGRIAPGLLVNEDVRWSEYAVLEAEDGRLSVDLRRIPLDVGRLLAAARASGMPHADWWADRWAAP